MVESMQNPAGPRYPQCHVRLEGTSANAVSIMMKVRRVLEEYLANQEYDPQDIKEIIEEFLKEAQSEDYGDVLTAAFRWVSVD